MIRVTLAAAALAASCALGYALHSAPVQPVRPVLSAIVHGRTIGIDTRTYACRPVPDGR